MIDVVLKIIGALATVVIVSRPAVVVVVFAGGSIVVSTIFIGTAGVSEHRKLNE